MFGQMMPEMRVWEYEGVKMTFLAYDTSKTKTIELKMRAVYEYDDPDHPGVRRVPNTVFAFYRAMPCLLSIELPDNPPRWAGMLKSAIEYPGWLNDPVNDYKQIEQFTPPETIYYTHDGYMATREKVLGAPEALQTPLGYPPNEFDDDPDFAEKKEPMSAVGTPSKQKSFPVQQARLAAPRKTKRSTPSRQT